MKKIIVFLVLFSFMAFFCSCGEKQEQEETTKEYTVSFINGDGSVLDSVKIKENEKVTQTTLIPTKEDFVFDHWDFDFDKVINSDISINPVFTKQTYFISFYAYDELIEKIEVSRNDEIVPPFVDVKKGYRFDGWSIDINNITANISSDIRVDALLIEAKKVLLIDKYGEKYLDAFIFSDDDMKDIEAPIVPFHTFVSWEKVNKTVEGYDAVAMASYTIDAITLNKESSDYWVRQNAKSLDVTKVIFSIDEINKINDEVIIGDYDKTKVVDVRDIVESAEGASIKMLIEKYSNINSNTVYNENGSIVSDKNAILNNRNLSAIGANVNVKYGIITDFCLLRSYPTNCYSKNKDSDQFQETSLNVGEGVAIYHTSLDGKWYFIQANNYNGWIEAKNVGLCPRDIMVSFLNAEEKAVIIANYIDIAGHHVRMGQAFPIKKMDGDNVIIKFPIRLNNGELEFASQKLTNKNDYNIGYLPYTIENILIQGFKILGMSYSWGDKYETGRDCSSTQNGILACFGFRMPRNTSNQRSIPTYSKVLSGLTPTQIKEYRPGTLIFSSGHVMMYIGIDENSNPYILHNTTGGGANRCIIQNFNEYSNKIIASLTLQK